MEMEIDKNLEEENLESDKKSFSTILYTSVMPKIYGIGASVVILGAMFKILNWPGANLMIGAGLTTEAVIFFLSAFEPMGKEYNWELAYPELNPDFAGAVPARSSHAGGGPDVSSKEYKAGIIALTKTLKLLNQAYSEEADQVVTRISTNQVMYENASRAMEEMHKASAEAEGFKMELQNLKEKISALNEIYDNTLSALRG